MRAAAGSRMSAIEIVAAARWRFGACRLMPYPKPALFMINSGAFRPQAFAARTAAEKVQDREPGSKGSCEAASHASRFHVSPNSLSPPRDAAGRLSRGQAAFHMASSSGQDLFRRSRAPGFRPGNHE